MHRNKKFFKFKFKNDSKESSKRTKNLNNTIFIKYLQNICKYL